MGTFISYLCPDEKTNDKYQLTANPKGPKLKRNHKLSIEDFNIKKEIGKGGFGSVFLVTKKSNCSQSFAMKKIKKLNIVENHLVENAVLEKDILLNSSHPFLCNLHYSFQDSSHIFLIMDYIKGGDLSKILKSELRFSEKETIFYITEVILALEYLHSKLNIIYRDLKMENILLNKDGHIKLIDFGLSKKADGKTNSFAGTLEYLAPELIIQKGYTKSIDFWALGIVIYEMLSGSTPFFNLNRKQCESLIIKNKPNFPLYFSKNSINVINSFLTTDPTKRLGSRSINDIKKHVFFSGVDWIDVYNKKMNPPHLYYLENADKKSIQVFKQSVVNKNEKNDSVSTINGITYLGDSQINN